MVPPNNLAIECRGITKDYPGHRALDKVSLQVERGSFHGFLGPNGAGKTTTMRILSGLLSYDEGELFLQGEPFAKIKDKLSDMVGFLPEVPLLYGALSVSELLAFAGELKGMGPTSLKSRCDHLIERCQLQTVAKRRVGNLSKGYRQRVGLAMALVHNPAIVILDEPTVGLDPVTLGPIRELLQGLKGEHTVLFSSHILSEVQILCDSVSIIDRGRVLQSGSVETIAQTLQHRSSYLLEVEGDHSLITPKIMAIEGVLEVKSRTDGKLEIYCTRSIDPRSKISQAVIESNLMLLGLSKIELSLEEIFKEVTSMAGQA